MADDGGTLGNEPHIPSADPLIGTRVGEYEIVEPLGEGGMGVVYRAIHPVIKKRVAVKILKPQVAADEVQVRRLTTEAEAVNAIGHRGIIDIFSLGTLPGGRPYVVMEFLDGEALDLWLQKLPGKRVTAELAVELLLEICAPLSAAHHANVIHRDLKPSNVYVCTQSDGTRFLKLLDFGLARRSTTLDGSTKQTSQTTVAGTPDYMAPEQARGLDVSPRSDIYSLGVIAFELLTGQVPFRGATAMDVMVAHVSTPAPAPKTLEPSIPDAFNELILRLLAKAPEDRPQSIEEVRSALERIGDLLGIPRARTTGELPVSPSPSSPSPQASPYSPPPAIVYSPPPQPLPVVPAHVTEELPKPQLKRSRAPLIAGGAVALVLVVVAVAYGLTRREVEEPPSPPAVVETAPVAAPPVEEKVEEAAPLEPLDISEPPVEAPALAVLKARVAKFETAAKKKKLSGKARAKLAVLKKQVAAAGTPEERLVAGGRLDDFERTYLKR